MKVNFSTTKDGRLQNVTTLPINESMPILELPDDFELGEIVNYVLRDGVLQLDPVEVIQTAEEKISDLKRNLAETDYITAKAVDAMTSADSLTALLTALKNIRTEYADVLAQRAAWRKEINDLEGKGDEK